MRSGIRQVAAAAKARPRARAAAATGWRPTAVARHFAAASGGGGGGADDDDDDDVRRVSGVLNDNDSNNDPYLVKKMNTAFRDHPTESVVSLFGLEIVGLYSMYCVLLATGLDPDANFAVAFAINRVVRRFRMPVDLAATAALSRAVPSLKKVHLSELLSKTGLLKSAEEREKERRAAGMAPAGQAGGGVAGAAMNVSDKITDSAKHIVDNYGAAYFVAARLTGAASVLSIYGALCYGVDVSAVTDFLGFGGGEGGGEDGAGSTLSGIGDTLGKWAAAVTLSSALYPATISLTAFVAPALANVRRSLVAGRNRS